MENKVCVECGHPQLKQMDECIFCEGDRFASVCNECSSITLNLNGTEECLTCTRMEVGGDG